MTASADLYCPICKSVCRQDLSLNAWVCESCGQKFYLDRELNKAVADAARDAEQLRVQLAGCLTAAEGHISQPATRGMYGWSPAYQSVLELRLDYERLKQKAGEVPVEVEGDAPEPEIIDRRTLDNAMKQHPDQWRRFTINYRKGDKTTGDVVDYCRRLLAKPCEDIVSTGEVWQHTTDQRMKILGRVTPTMSHPCWVAEDLATGNAMFIGGTPDHMVNWTKEE